MTTTFYIFHGNDDLSIDEAVDKLRAQMGDDANADLNISEFDGQTASVAEVVNAALSYPFLADKRLVIVKGLVEWITRKGAGAKGKRELELLLDELPHLPEHARLVLVERQKIPDNRKLIKLARSQANGYEKAFGVPKDSTSWIIQRARDEYAVEIESNVAAAIASVTRDDLRRADNELFKLVSYVGMERAITEEDVATLTPYVAEANIFNMVDAMAEGRSKQAILMMHRILSDPKEDPFRFYGMIVRQFRLLLLTREHLTLGGSSNPGDIAQAINIKSSWQAEKLARLSRSFDLQQLEAIYRQLQDNDVKMKTGRIAPPLALDLFVASLSR
jgi:DNA polymerase III subunit delta